MAYRQMEQVLSRSQAERDVTYQELRDRNEQLQQRLADLAATHAQLQEAQKMLVHGERLSAMGQMAAAIVHDLNGPLAVIAGNAELLRMRGSNAGDRPELDSILEAVRRIHRLSGHLLDLSGRRHNNLSTTDLGELARDVVHFLTPMMTHVECKIEETPDLPAVEADASQLEQVLVNFVLNALDSMQGTPNRHLRIRTGRATIKELRDTENANGRASQLAVHVDHQDTTRDWLYIEVEDTGVGMDEEMIDKAFEVFYTTKGEQGTGLGLAISKRIVESQLGSILVASGVGRGSSFRLLLPTPAPTDSV